MTTDDMLTEAIRMGTQSATQASRFMSLSVDLVTAVNDAIKHLECGMTSEARDILVKARRHAGQHVLVPGTDLVMTVMRTIATIREQNGAAPYDGWAAIHGERAAKAMREALREEAVAVLDALGIKEQK